MPHLIADGDGVLMSWLEPVDPADTEGKWRVATARYENGTWSERHDVTERQGMFINWADFPSAIRSGETHFAHWLQRGSEGGYDYAVTVGTGSAGATDKAPFVLHEDTAPVEHGFVSAVPLPGGRIGTVWLDGRDFTGPEPHEMQVRFREVGPDGPTSDEILLDNRACDCCQTDLAVAGDGLVAVYRDRSEAEIRDISIVRSSEDGWSDPVRVHDDGWEIAGCPVNGPAVDANGDDVVVAWFTGAQDTPRVRVAFSSDGGRTFGSPQQVDDGAPLGRVDVAWLSDQPIAVVTWIENTASEGAAELRSRWVTSTAIGGTHTVAQTTAIRNSGFPQMVRIGDDLLFAWTDTEMQRIRVQEISPGQLGVGASR